MRCNRAPAHERGNVFAIVFLGVVLFAALIFAATRGLNSGTTILTDAQAKNEASAMIFHATQVERAVSRLMQAGISEADISFENDVVAGYEHAPVVSTDARVFEHTKGQGAPWQTPPGRATAEGDNQWVFSGNWIITDLGDDARSELVMVLFVPQNICAAINTRLNNGVDLSASIGTAAFTKFTGTYTDNGASTLAAAVNGSGCYRGDFSEGAQSGRYAYLHVLLPR